MTRTKTSLFLAIASVVVAFAGASHAGVKQPIVHIPVLNPEQVLDACLADCKKKYNLCYDAALIIYDEESERFEITEHRRDCHRKWEACKAQCPK